MKKGKLIVGNWKMNPQTTRDAAKLFKDVAREARTITKASVAVCVPDVYLNPLAALKEKKVSLGAQDLFWEKEGAFTGEASAAMVANSGAKMVIVGHSERRARGESDEDIARKVKAALAAKLVPILCVGERERAGEGEHISFVTAQLTAALKGLPRADASRVVVAYEPIWAIGKQAKRSATKEEGLEMAIVIRRTLSHLFTRPVAESMPILYGGSVDEKNAKDFLFDAGMDGLLVGRASLSAKTFGGIIRTTNTGI